MQNIPPVALASLHAQARPYGTLNVLVLKTLESMGPLNGYPIARRIEQLSENLLELNQGSIYPALLRLGKKGWIKDLGKE